MFFSVLSSAALVAVASAHSVILNAQGDAGSPASTGFQVDVNIPRNCTSISPCQQDATIIRDAEIASNAVNSCGRTQLSGNIDVGENTENALAAGAVTQVQAGSTLTVTIHQVNADGAGPYVCDLDETSNSGVISHNLTVTNNIPGANGLSQAKEQDFNITVTMPDDLNCSGASTGNVCTVRCRNNAVAGPFGGCFAVQQTDNSATNNTPETIPTEAEVSLIDSQTLQNQADLPDAIANNVEAGSDESKANLEAVESLLQLTVTTVASPVQTPEAALGNAAVDVDATTTSSAPEATVTSGRGRKNQGQNNGNGDNENGRFNRFNQNKRSALRWAKRIDESN